MLITRPEPGAAQTAGRLATLGFQPVVAPLFSVIAVPTAPLPSASLAATVLTSRNGILGCPPFLFGRPVFTVGSATAARAREAGFVTVIDADANAAALPGLILRHLLPGAKALYLPTARRQGLELARALRNQGFRVIRRVVYDTVAVPVLPAEAADHLKQEDIAAALFFSAETAHTFTRLVRAAGLSASVANIEAVSISEQTAMALRTLPWRRISVAAKPNQDEMLVMLK